MNNDTENGQSITHCIYRCDNCEISYIAPFDGRNDFSVGCRHCEQHSVVSRTPIQPDDDVFYCVKCGSPEVAHYVAGVAARLRATKHCFHCDFWNEKLKNFVGHDPNAVIIDGGCYYVGQEKTIRADFRGYGGRAFTIRKHDGTLIRTTNLWHQGKVPRNFRAALPDNAVFVEDITPTPKSPEIEELLTSTVGISRQEALEKRICTFCRGDATTFRDFSSTKEYAISGLCQKCQDLTFNR